MSGFVERVFAGKWVAGATVKDALRRAKELNALRISAIINFLGEDFKDKKEATDAVFTYLQLMNEIKKNKIDASVSVKVTQLGLEVSREFARKNFERIANRARRHGIFLWLDMEAPDTIDDTISIYESQVRRRGVGIALQARMKRSEKDLRRLLRKKAVVRLVKGAYKGSAKSAFDTKEKVDRNFALLMLSLFKG